MDKTPVIQGGLWAHPSLRRLGGPLVEVVRTGVDRMTYPKLSVEARELSAAERFEGVRGVSSICPARHLRDVVLQQLIQVLVAPPPHQHCRHELEDARQGDDAVVLQVA